MNFYDILEESIFYPGNHELPNGDLISIDFLNEHFGHLETASEMKENTQSEGLKEFFDWLVEEGKLNP